MDHVNGWRPLVAVLANPGTRQVAARLMLGETLASAVEGLSPAKARRVTEAIVQSGLVGSDGETLDPRVFREVLDSAGVPKRTGIARFVDGRRIRQYPSNPRERGELLAWVARDVFAPDEVLTEREVNDRLVPYSEDVAVLRRYLVDYRLVERRADGTEYALTGEDPAAAAG